MDKTIVTARFRATVCTIIAGMDAIVRGANKAAPWDSRLLTPSFTDASQPCTARIKSLFAIRKKGFTGDFYTVMVSQPTHQFS
jgi:hypothetical protein